METFFQIRKVDEEKRLVYGRATQETLDRSGEVMDYESSKPLIEAWSAEAFDATGGLSKGNIRSMHRADIAAGKVEEIEFDDDAKAVDLVVKVVDEAEWAKVTEGVYTGFSMGGKYARKWADPSITTATGKAAVRYTAQPSEISLVDRPCVPTAGFFEIRKTDGTTEQRAFHQGETMEDETKVGEPAELKKGIWEAKRFLGLIDEARWLQKELAEEKNREGDASTVPEDLKTCLGMLADLAEGYIGEQLAEIKAGGAIAAASEVVAAKADEPDDMEKAAKTGKKAMRSKIAAHANEMAAMCKGYLDLYGKEDGDGMEAADKSDAAEDLQKADAPDVEDIVRRAVADAIRPFQESLTKSAPVAPATRAPSLRALDKSEDSTLAKAGDGLDDLRKAAETDPVSAIKLAHQNPLS
jgi:hypothetical protein